MIHNGATSMSRIESFVALVRQGRVEITRLEEIQMAIFTRMVEKIHLMGNAVLMIYRMAGYLDPRDHTIDNLRKILSPWYLRPNSLPATYWVPVPSDRFLTNIPPAADAPANDLWRIVWTRLRLMYAGGRI